MEPTGLWMVRVRDFARGAFWAFVSAVVMCLVGIVGPDFNIFTVDWAAVFRSTVNAGVIGFVVYVGGIFTSDEKGRLFGRL